MARKKSTAEESTPKKAAASSVSEKRYFKEQLIKGGLFPADIARAVLKDGTEYTVNEAADLIKQYYEREVI